MPGRTLLLVSAVLLSIALITSADGARAATSGCLAKPDQSAPQGMHWYYQTDRGSQTKCWYLAEQRGKAADTAPADTASSDTASADNDVATTASTKPPASTAPAKPVAATAPAKPPAAIASPNAVSLERAAAQKPARALLPPDPQPAADTLMPPANAQSPVGNARAEWLDAPRPEHATSLVPAQPAASTAATHADASPAASPKAVAQAGPNTRWPTPTVAGTLDRPVLVQTPTTFASADPQAAASAGAAPAADTTATPAPQPPPNAKGAPATAPADSSTAGYSEYFLLLMFAMAVVALGLLGWTAIRYLTERQLALREHPAWRRLASQKDDARPRADGDALLAMGDMPMDLFGERSTRRPPPQRRQAATPPPPRRFEDEIDEIEQLLALARQPGTLVPGSWPLAPEQPRAAE